MAKKQILIFIATLLHIISFVRILASKTFKKHNMSKKIMIVAVLFLALGTVSCKKDYVCDCHIDYNDGTPHGDMEYDIKDSKKKDADEACHDKEHDLEKLPNVEKVECELK
jgi:hypothetical protein